MLKQLLPLFLAALAPAYGQELKAPPPPLENPRLKPFSFSLTKLPEGPSMAELFRKEMGGTFLGKLDRVLIPNTTPGFPGAGFKLPGFGGRLTLSFGMYNPKQIAKEQTKRSYRLTMGDRDTGHYVPRSTLMLFDNISHGYNPFVQACDLPAASLKFDFGHK